MKLGLIKRIDKSDLAKTGDVPSWVGPLLDTLNPFIEKVGLALQNKLSFADNFLGKEFETTFTSNTELEINPYITKGTPLRVKGVIPLTTGEVFITGFKWVQKANGNIGVTLTLSGATSAKIKLFILLG